MKSEGNEMEQSIQLGVEPKDRSLWKRVYWPNAIYLILTPLAALIMVPLHLHFEGFYWKLWLFMIVFGSATSFCITGGYHRLFAHRSFIANPITRFCFLLIGAASFQGSALKWATDHRRHHRYVDTDEDPYNIKRGFFYAHMGWLFLEDDPRYKGKFPQDLLREKMVMIQHHYYLWFAFLMGFGFPTLVGYFMGSAFGGFVVAGALRLVLTNHSTFFINSFCHIIGKQPYSDEHSARDSFIMAIFAFGEGYHNFHHQFQSDYRNGIRWYHWDPTKWVVRLLATVGFTRGLKRTQQVTIIRAQLSMEEKRLLAVGVPVESLHPLKDKVEDAIRRFKLIREDYEVMKTNMKSRSDEKLKELKIEMKQRRRELKTAWALWLAYGRHMKTVARVA